MRKALDSLKRFWGDIREDPKRAAINIAGLVMMGIAMVFIAVGFIMYPVVITGTDAILAYVYTSNASINASYFTGLTQITGVVPLLTLMGFVTASVVTGFLGYRMQKTGAGGALSPQNLIMLGVGLVFIAVGLIIYPVSLDGIATVLHGNGAGISASYVGLSPILRVTPILVLMGFVTAGIVSGFFGIKGMARG